MNRGTTGLAPLCVVLFGCTALTGGSGGGGNPNVPGTGGGSDADLDQCVQRDWGKANAAVKLQSFLGATANVAGTVADVQDSVVDTCRDMGKKLGVPAKKMKGNPKNPARAACKPVAAKISSEMSDLKAKADLKVRVISTPPRCEVDMDGYAKCTGKCDAELEPGKVDVKCEGGHIVGKCSAKCQGACNVDVSGACKGTCEGTCTAQCKGTCKGHCEGQCSSKGPNGQCNGKCEGTCHGTCEGGCEGKCEGECWVEGKADCNGQCRGGCSVDYEAPRCTGEVKPPKASAECEASCDAEFNAEAQCKPGEVRVVVDGNIKENISKRVKKLRAALEMGYGGLRATIHKAERLKSAAVKLKTSGKAMVKGFGDLGMQMAKATQCVSLASESLVKASADLSATVEVQASLTASVTAG